MPDLQPQIDRLQWLHKRLCPRQVLGVRMGLLAGELLGVDLHTADRRLLALVESDGCFADGVSVATGCWLGRRTLRLVDRGKVALVAVDTATARAVRIHPHPSARTHAQVYAPDAPSRWASQLVAYQIMPVAELLCATPVRLATAELGSYVAESARLVCVECGEEVSRGHEVHATRGVVCSDCAGGAYYIRQVAA